MKTCNEEEVRVLELNIQERTEWLRRVAAFISAIVLERGTSKQETEWRTVWTLANFEGFDLRATFGLTMFGGDRYELWWKALSNQPRPTNFGPFTDPDLSMVIHGCGGIDTVRVRNLPLWEGKLETLMAYKDEIIAAMEYYRANKEEERQLESTTVVHRADLEKRALELGLR